MMSTSRNNGRIVKSLVCVPQVQPGENDAPAYNTLLSREVQKKLPFINEDKVPTIIFGADVTVSWCITLVCCRKQCGSLMWGRC